MRLVRGEEKRRRQERECSEAARSSASRSSSMRAPRSARINVSEAIENYIVALVFATRYPDKLDKELAKWIQVGVSPRGAIGLDKVSRAYAWLQGRDYVDARRREGRRPRRVPAPPDPVLRGACAAA